MSVNRRSFLKATTGCAVAAAVPAARYGWRCVDIDYAAKVVTFGFVADCPYEDSVEYKLLNGDRLHYGKQAAGILSFASPDEVLETNQLHLGPTFTTFV